jgi:hypothetical protein
MTSATLVRPAYTPVLKADLEQGEEKISKLVDKWKALNPGKSVNLRITFAMFNSAESLTQKYEAAKTRLQHWYQDAIITERQMKEALSEIGKLYRTFIGISANYANKRQYNGKTENIVWMEF